MKKKVFLPDVIEAVLENIPEQTELRSRFEYVLENNPGIDSERLKSPAELQDVEYALAKVMYKGPLKDAYTFLSVGAALGTAGFFGIKKTVNDSETSILDMIVFASSVFFCTPTAVISAVYGISSLKEGISRYISFKRSGHRPLSDRERTLNDYIWGYNTKTD